MQIGKATLDILKNFSTINPSIIIKAGDEIATMSNNKDIVAYAKIDEEFAREVAIYDLNEFIATLNLFEAPEVDLEEHQMTISDNSSQCTYGYADPDIITTPTSKIKFPGGDVEFDLTKEVFDRIMKASSTLGLANIVITKDKQHNIVLKATDVKNANSNAFSIIVGKDISDKQYRLLIPAGNLKMIRGDYTVKISKRLIAQFSNSSVEYYIALEKSSEYNDSSAE